MTWFQIAALIALAGIWYAIAKAGGRIVEAVNTSSRLNLEAQQRLLNRLEIISDNVVYIALPDDK